MTPPASPLSPSPWTGRDLWFSAVLASVAAAVAFAAVSAYAAAGLTAQFYQSQFAPAVLFACGHGFQNPAAAQPQAVGSVGQGQAEAMAPGFESLGEFLSQRRSAMRCSELPATFSPSPLGMFQAAHRYLMMFAAIIWRLVGVSWPALSLVAAAFAAATAGLLYLFLRAGMGRVLASLLTLAALLSPFQLSQMPHLRDYAKAPFFVLAMAVVAWIATTRSSRVTTILVLAGTGAALGLGFGMRTDVAIYLPFILVVLVLARPGLDRADALTRMLAATAAVATFFVVAMPIIRAYQSGDNLAHVAMLGFTDESRDWLALQPPPYSYGYLYDDGYQATKIAAYADNVTELERPVRLASIEYAYWGNALYRRLLSTFPADALVRAWAAVVQVFALPFERNNVRAYAWLGSAFAPLFDAREAMLGWIAVLPPTATLAVLVVALGTVSIRLAILVVLVATIFPGISSVQFQGRHVFHLEVLPLFACGAVLGGAWRLVRTGLAWRRPSNALLLRGAIVTLVMTTAVVAPIAAARGYQAGTVRSLLSAYAETETESVGGEAVTTDALVRIPVTFKELPRPRYVDTNVLSLDLGGADCDADTVSLTFRHYAKDTFTDLTHTLIVPVPPAPATTRIIVPVFALGQRWVPRDLMGFTGLEVPAAEYACLSSLRSFRHPERFPVLVDSVLLPGWEDRPLYETLRDLERSQTLPRLDAHAVPAGLQPGRRWMSQLQRLVVAPAYRSPQVKRVDPDGIEARGSAADPSAYLLAWPYESRPAGSAFFVEGDVFDGGLTIGIQQNERWLHQLNIDRLGKFRAVIRLDQDGLVSPVLANHQLEGSHRSVITRYGWLPPNP